MLLVLVANQTISAQVIAPVASVALPRPTMYVGKLAKLSAKLMQATHSNGEDRSAGEPRETSTKKPYQVC